jgi:ABC-2 type transport system permease protein
MINLLLHEVRVRWRAILGWTIGLGFYSVIYMIIYPALPAEMRAIDPQALALLRSLGVQTLATFEGFILGTEFNFLPLLVGVFGVFMGIGALVGEEDDGILELLAALPISRVQLILAKAAALVIAAFIVLLVDGLIAMGVFTALQIDTPITAPDLFWVILSHWLMAFVFMTLSLFLGAFLPNRRSTMSAAAAALLVSFFGNNLAGIAPVLEPCQPFFPHSHFERVVEMLTGDVAWGDMLTLLLMGLGFLILAVLSFQRRNLTVGAWPWQRPKLAK